MNVDGAIEEVAKSVILVVFFAFVNVALAVHVWKLFIDELADIFGFVGRNKADVTAIAVHDLDGVCVVFVLVVIFQVAGEVLASKVFDAFTEVDTSNFDIIQMWIDIGPHIKGYVLR